MNAKMWLIRWSSGSVDLLFCREPEIPDLLDQLASPGAACWRVYLEPLWISFKVPRLLDGEDTEHSPDQIPDEIRIAYAYMGDPLHSQCDEQAEMSLSLFRHAFPSLSKLVSTHLVDDVAGAEVRAAYESDQSLFSPDQPVLPRGWRRMKKASSNTFNRPASEETP